MVGNSRAVAALVASVLVAHPVLAQSPAQKREAQDLTKQAIAKSQAKDHAAAVELYLQAYAIVPATPLLTNIGTEYQAAGKPNEALEYFCKYLAKEPAGNMSPYAITQAKALWSQLSGGLAIEDKDVCTIPVPPPRPVVAPMTTEVLAPAPAPSDPGRPLKIAGIGVGAAGVVGLGLGVFFGVRARSIASEITDHPPGEPWPDDIGDLEDRGARYETMQITFLAVGGALVVGGAVLYVVGRGKTASAERVAITPTASSSGVGLVLGGTF